MRPIFLHQESIFALLRELSHRQVTLFLCAVCQRQMGVYCEYVSGHPWDNRSELRSILNTCWHVSVFNENYEAIIEPEMTDFLDVDFNQSSSRFAIDAFSSIWHLTRWIVSKDECSIAGPVENAFSILDGYIYELVAQTEVTAQNDLMVDQHQLVQQEIHRQNLQLQRVSSLGWGSENWRSFQAEVEGETLLSA
ncbi:DUF416 family protein [Yoonia sp. BS5-3]|uniref:DUF416 family protein n=1 Tax=Yoonia phaeophyticola TaxID=3137369 RepID=A0ABZ2V898_9RHOB